MLTLKGLGRTGGEAVRLQGKILIVVPSALNAGKVFLYKYPAGGNPFKKIVGFQSAGSAAVSLAPSR